MDQIESPSPQRSPRALPDGILAVPHRDVNAFNALPITYIKLELFEGAACGSEERVNVAGFRDVRQIIEKISTNSP